MFNYRRSSFAAIIEVINVLNFSAVLVGWKNKYINDFKMPSTRYTFFHGIYFLFCFAAFRRQRGISDGRKFKLECIEILTIFITLTLSEKSQIIHSWTILVKIEISLLRLRGKKEQLWIMKMFFRLIRYPYKCERSSLVSIIKHSNVTETILIPNENLPSFEIQLTRHYIKSF